MPVAPKLYLVSARSLRIPALHNSRSTKLVVRPLLRFRHAESVVQRLFGDDSAMCCLLNG